MEFRKGMFGIIPFLFALKYKGVILLNILRGQGKGGGGGRKPEKVKENKFKN